MNPVRMRVSGREYTVTLKVTPWGVTWSTPTRNGHAAGTAQTPIGALESARDFLQVSKIWELPEEPEQDLELLLEMSVNREAANE